MTQRASFNLIEHTHTGYANARLKRHTAGSVSVALVVTGCVQACVNSARATLHSLTVLLHSRPRLLACSVWHSSAISASDMGYLNYSNKGLEDKVFNLVPLIPHVTNFIFSTTSKVFRWSVLDYGTVALQKHGCRGLACQC